MDVLSFDKSLTQFQGFLFCLCFASACRNFDVKDKPFFEEGKNIAPQNVSALIGKTAFLTCVVGNLGKAKSVSFESACIINEKENPENFTFNIMEV